MIQMEFRHIKVALSIGSYSEIQLIIQRVDLWRDYIQTLQLVLHWELLPTISLIDNLIKTQLEMEAEVQLLHNSNQTQEEKSELEDSKRLVYLLQLITNNDDLINSFNNLFY